MEAVVDQKLAYLAIFFGGSSWPKMAYLAKKKMEAVVHHKMAYLAKKKNWRQ